MFLTKLIQSEVDDSILSYLNAQIRRKTVYGNEKATYYDEKISYLIAEYAYSTTITYECRCCHRILNIIKFGRRQIEKNKLMRCKECSKKCIHRYRTYIGIICVVVYPVPKQYNKYLKYSHKRKNYIVDKYRNWHW